MILLIRFFILIATQKATQSSGFFFVFVLLELCWKRIVVRAIYC